MFLLLVGAIFVPLYGVWLPGQILFSNDGPLGRLMSECHHLPGRFFGCWQDLDGIGYSEGSAAPSITFALLGLLGPLWFSKLYAAFALLTLGLGAWCFLRQVGLGPQACVLGGLAAALNSNFFSTACWGLGSHTLAAAMTFFALAALANTSSRWRWPRVVLAGLAVGMGISEGADLGAIFSVFVAAFLCWQAVISEGPPAKNLCRGLVQVALVALFAALLASRAMSELVATNITGIAGTEQDAETRAGRWDWATQWSLPKKEALGIAVPGLFGYRMDTPEGGAYWGTIGRAATWEKYFAQHNEGPPPNKGFIRYSGNGFYAGIAVLLVGLWAGVEALRRKGSVFSVAQRKRLYFWLVVSLVCLLFAFGRFAPFYQLVYALPYFSTIRNPVKFLHVLSLALAVLFAYGVDGLWRKYVQPTGANPAARRSGIGTWWTNATLVEKRWVRGCLLALVGSGLAWLVYMSSSQKLVQYLSLERFNASVVPGIAAFSIRQVGWFLLFFALAIGWMVLVMAGAFRGARARWGSLLLGSLLVLDLGRADQPWVVIWNYDDIYALNPIIERLRVNPWEHRVAVLPFRPPPAVAMLDRVYRSEWMQHQFPYYNIQSVDLVQLSRVPTDLKSYGAAFTPTNEADIQLVGRRWQLTNTRYVLAPVDVLNAMEREIDSGGNRFHILERFNIQPRPGVVRPTKPGEVFVTPDANGPFALLEFAGALPRAKLYSHWQVNTNAPALLQELTNPSFDPQQTVLVASPLPAPAATTAPGQNDGKVEIVSYASKDIVLKSQSAAASVLLLNDHFDSAWRVLVDGQPGTILRCNYVMRGVYLQPGPHTVEFRFQHPVRFLYVSLAVIGVGIGLLGFVVIAESRNPRQVQAPAASQRPQNGVAAPKPVAGVATKPKRLASKGKG
jgi:hypothetical protein